MAAILYLLLKHLPKITVLYTCNFCLYLFSPLISDSLNECVGGIGFLLYIIILYLLLLKCGFKSGFYLVPFYLQLVVMVVYSVLSDHINKLSEPFQETIIISICLLFLYIVYGSVYFISVKIRKPFITALLLSVLYPYFLAKRDVAANGNI